MFHDVCQSVTLAFCQKTHVSHDHHPRGQCCSSASIAYDAPCMEAISYQKIFASALIPTVSPLLTLVTLRNILLLQSLLNSILYRQANVRRRKDAHRVGTAARGSIARLSRLPRRLH